MPGFSPDHSTVPLKTIGSAMVPLLRGVGDYLLAPRVAHLTEELQIERRPSGPPVAASPEPQCRAFTKRRSNEFGELVIRRIRICEEVVRGPASRWPGESPRREVYGRPIPPTNIPVPP